MKLNFRPWGLALLIFTLSSHVAFAKDGAEIQQIRQWYNQIQDDASLKKTIIKTRDDEPHGVTVTRYATVSGELRKLHIATGGEHGAEDLTYYYHGGNLFFIYSAYQSWQFSGETNTDGQAGTIDSGGQSRYYFSEGKCIQALGKNVQTTSPDKLATLLQKEENQPIVYHSTAPLYLKKSKALAEVTNREELEKFLSQRH